MLKKVIESLYAAVVLVGVVLVILTLISPIGKAVLFSGMGANVAWAIVALALVIFIVT